MIKSIGFDIDGCLHDYSGYVVTKFYGLYKQLTGRYYTGRIDMSSYTTADVFPDNDCPEVIRIMDTEVWFDYVETAPFEPFVKELFDELHKRGIKIHIVTARYDNDPERMERLIKLTKKRFFDEKIPVDEFHIGIQDKVSVIIASGIEVMVEDAPENILNISEVIPVFKVNRLYNELVRGSNIYRIDTLYPKVFMQLLDYMDNHRNYLGQREKLDEKANLDIFFAGVRCYINPEKLSDPNAMIFMVPLSGKNMTSMINRWESYTHGARLVDLNLIDTPDKIPDPKIVSIIQKNNPKGVNIAFTNEISDEVYRIRSAIITDILKYIKGKRGKTIIFGPQIMSIERGDLLRYKDCPFIIPEVTDAQKEIIMKSIFKEDYNIAILLEDLDEISLNVRKFKIIAGTDPDHLEGYINREYFNSEGVDVVEFCTNERPVNPENLIAHLNMDTWVIGDLHLKKDDPAKTEMIIEHINQFVKAKDSLLIIGDFDGKKGASLDIIGDVLDRLVCKNVYMLVGNNDGYKLSDYIRMGIKGIMDTVEVPGSLDGRIIVSHCPVALRNGEINIHGHLHGGRVYWNMDAEGHYDVYTEDFYPIRIRECIEVLQKNLYRAKGIHISYT